MVSYLGPGVVAKLATRGSALAGGAAAVGMAAPAGVSESYDRAIDAGLDEGEALEKSMQGALPGAIQVAPLASILKPLPKNLQKKAVGQLYGVLRTGGQEASVEGAGAVLQNLIEQSYNPEQGTWDDAAYRAAIGGASGGAVQGVTQALTRGRGMGADKESEGEPTVEDAAEQVDAGPEPAAPEGESTSAPQAPNRDHRGRLMLRAPNPKRASIPPSSGRAQALHALERTPARDSFVQTRISYNRLSARRANAFYRATVIRCSANELRRPESWMRWMPLIGCRRALTRATPPVQQMPTSRPAIS